MSAPTDPRTLRLTAFPPGPGPYERYELIVEATGEILLQGTFPLDGSDINALVAETCSAYRKRIEQAP